ncbi:hypothetical protein Tco_0261452 [Tanacetum coccineum]
MLWEVLWETGFGGLIVNLVGGGGGGVGWGWDLGGLYGLGLVGGQVVLGRCGLWVGVRGGVGGSGVVASGGGDGVRNVLVGGCGGSSMIKRRRSGVEWARTGVGVGWYLIYPLLTVEFLELLVIRVILILGSCVVGLGVEYVSGWVGSCTKWAVLGWFLSNLRVWGGEREVLGWVEPDSGGRLVNFGGRFLLNRHRGRATVGGGGGHGVGCRFPVGSGVGRAGIFDPCGQLVLTQRQYEDKEEENSPQPQKFLYKTYCSLGSVVYTKSLDLGRRKEENRGKEEREEEGGIGREDITEWKERE